MNKTYYINFDTKDRPGAIMAVTVQLNRVKKKSMSIDLCSHPLYDKLVQYVQNNPVRKPPDE